MGTTWRGFITGRLRSACSGFGWPWHHDLVMMAGKDSEEASECL